MKFTRKLKLLTLIILSSTVFFIYNKTNYNNITYTSLGDSLAVGIDSYGQRTYSYNDYVKEYLISKKKLKNYSKTFTSEDMTIEKLYNYILVNKEMNQNNKKENIKEILQETDYLTISIGLNDLLYKLTLTNELNDNNLNIIIEEISNSFDELIKEIRKVYRHEIFVIGYYDINIDNKIYKKAIKKLNNIYKANSEVIYISTYIISENKNIFLSNPSKYYPNYKGYQVISSKIIDKISKKLEK